MYIVPAQIVFNLSSVKIVECRAEAVRIFSFTIILHVFLSFVFQMVSFVFKTYESSKKYLFYLKVSVQLSMNIVKFPRLFLLTTNVHAKSQMIIPMMI
jgi:hypothetical protein